MEDWWSGMCDIAMMMKKAKNGNYDNLNFFSTTFSRDDIINSFQCRSEILQNVCTLNVTH